MEADPVLLARIQFAFTIAFHIIFPSLHHRSGGFHRHTAGALVFHRPGASASPGAVLDQDFRRLVRHGRRVRHRAQLPVRHQLEPLFGRGRQRHRPADRLRGASPRSSSKRRSSASCCSAGSACRRGCTCCRPSSSRSAPRSRRSGSCPPIAGCRRRPVTRSATASPFRSTGWRSSSIRASRIASRTCSLPPI